MTILKTEEYTKLIIIQYKNKEKAKATIELYVKELFADDVYFQVQDAFNLDTAIGVQLDILGKYIGVDRFYKGQELSGEDFFSMTNYADDPAQKGMSDYIDFNTKTGKFLTYSNILSNTLKLDDDDYRFILKLKIIQNNSNHSHKSIDDSLFEFFGLDVIASSSGNMQMIYYIPSQKVQLIEVAIEKKVLPRPIGVGINYIIKKETNKIFGMTTYDTTIDSNLKTGFSTYADYDTKIGESLTYDKLIN